ncbi:hypothetical protein QN345_01770 [Cryobacterium sp. 10I1]|uniref:hypothetical protein n=1 Tax=unclassified Cryobacterium TaxID=2649013 RepID=UPI002B232E01|nr:MULTISPECIES: hypothetical protein [unclassified Cryobacterium]MEB0203167.1 hypothetical protein [Cryobacterium sp. 5I3]MEB0304062.1 hypothetical protein [Cryobacterium sp. 10I1]
MAGKRGVAVPRPIKGTEYELFFGNTAAQRGWTDLKASAKNALADAYDYLTAHPARYDPDRCYQLRGDLSTVLVDGVVLPQWQYKVTDGARLWYAVDEPNAKAKKPGRVYITKAATGHPNETDSTKNFR